MMNIMKLNLNFSWEMASKFQEAGGLIQLRGTRNRWP